MRKNTLIILVSTLLLVSLPGSAFAHDAKDDTLDNLDLSNIQIESPSVLKAPLQDTDGNWIKKPPGKVRTSTSCVAPAFTVVTCRGNVAVIGWNKNAYTTYRWSVPFYVFSQAGVRVKGFTSHRKGYWKSAGAGSSGSARVHWGNIMAYKTVKVLSIRPPAGVTIWWD